MLARASRVAINKTIRTDAKEAHEGAPNTDIHGDTRTQKKRAHRGDNTGIISVNRTRKKETTQGESL